MESCEECTPGYLANDTRSTDFTQCSSRSWNIVLARCRSLEEDLESEVLSWFVVAHVHGIHLFQFRFAGTEQCWHPGWLVTLTFFRTGNIHVPLVQCVDAYSVDGTPGGDTTFSASCSTVGS